MSTKTKIIINTVLVVLLVVALVFVTLAIVFAPVRVRGDSMLPNFENDQVVWMNQRTNRFERGDVVILPSPTTGNINLIKRVVGVAGDVVHITTQGRVYINGYQVDETEYNIHFGNRVGGSVTNQFTQARVIEEGYLVVLGDNRPNSTDSRDFGAVAVTSVLGRVV